MPEPGAFAPARRRRASSPDRPDQVRIVEVSHWPRIGEATGARVPGLAVSAPGAFAPARRRRASSHDRPDQVRIVEVSRCIDSVRPAGARRPGFCRGLAVSASGAFAPARWRRLEFPAH
jgi:hypothetical protein